MARLTEGEPLVRFSGRLAPEDLDALAQFAEQDGREPNLSAEIRRLIRAEVARREESS